MSAFLGIDVGTSGCRAVLVDENGRLLKSVVREYPLYTMAPGWTEQNPDDWLTGVRECIAEIGGEFEGVGFTGQMHGSVFLDSVGRVIRPALLWNDQRTAKQVQDMAEKCGLAEIFAETCNPPLTGFQAGKLLWLRSEEPESFAKLRHLLLPKDYVRYGLTGELATDVSDASGTGLFNVPNRTWSSQLLHTLEIDAQIFPNAHESPAVVGKLGEAAMVAGAGDQAAAAVGTGAVTNEIVSVCLGTSGVVFAAQSDASYDTLGRVHTFCHANGAWHSMGVMLSCGGAIRWARDVFGFSSYEEMNALAQSCGAPSAVFKPYLCGERTPHNDPDLRGSFHRLNLACDRAEIAASVFYGVSFALLDGFDIIRELRGTNCESVRVTGGGSKSDHWMHLLADMFGVPTLRLELDEGPAFGAALLAGVGASHWKTVEEACGATVRIKQTFEPNMTRHSFLSEARDQWLKF